MKQPKAFKSLQEHGRGQKQERRDQQSRSTLELHASTLGILSELDVLHHILASSGPV